MPSVRKRHTPRCPRATDTAKRCRCDGAYQARYYDEEGRRQSVGGFSSRPEAEAWLQDKLLEIAAVRRGGRPPTRDRPATVDTLLDLFTEKHGRNLDPSTKRRLESQLRRAREEFGDHHPDSLRRIELEDWRETLAAGSRHGTFTSFRQALRWALKRGLMDSDPSADIANPRRNRHERKPIHPFESWEEIEAVADELGQTFGAYVAVAVGTGLRPEELFGLHRADVDREARLLHVRRRFTRGELKQGGKTPGSVRAVPLRQRVLEAIEAMPPRIDTPILFPGPRGGYYDPNSFGVREWKPALRAAGIEHRSLYTTRHSFATWAIEAGMDLWHLARSWERPSRRFRTPTRAG